MLTLKIVQAKFGDCLILKYGDDPNPKYMLIDGGPGGVYRDHLRQELETIKESGGQLDLVVLSHIDGDHITGLLDLTEELRENMADEVEPLIDVNGLWANTFSNTISKDNNLEHALKSMLNNVNNLASVLPHGDLAVQSILQGNTLRRNALLLNIPLNDIADQDIISTDTITEPVEMENIKLTMIGPNEENLDKLREEWHEWIRKHEPNVLTTDKELLNNIDRSVPNLSSIMFLLEADGTTILFTGDGRGDFILEGLEKAGLTDDNGKIHVDVFKAPHHGSIRNTTREFFDKVTADKYVISADGRHDNPGFETMSWIVESSHEQGREIEIICTNKTEATEKIESEYPADEFGYRFTYMPEGDHSMDLDF